MVQLKFYYGTMGVETLMKVLKIYKFNKGENKNDR